ncbi:CLUMA_CG014932, isoform A [Clunio marinus]|uniref:CLUMA_CG014932, isoform A n=1 Tax=Clunio marinus TaxID=568069 RepID=A0A1J1IQA2_9DIPT|nr:CLUMA_CG014932, isoform A [Clunio marinus]
MSMIEDHETIFKRHKECQFYSCFERPKASDIISISRQKLFISDEKPSKTSTVCELCNGFMGESPGSACYLEPLATTK